VSIIEPKASTILQSIQGVHGASHVTLEEETWAGRQVANRDRLRLLTPAIVPFADHSESMAYEPQAALSPDGSSLSRFAKQNLTKASSFTARWIGKGSATYTSLNSFSI